MFRSRFVGEVIVWMGIVDVSFCLLVRGYVGIFVFVGIGVGVVVLLGIGIVGSIRR